MAKIINQRITAETDEEFVVFLIGMRINKLWKIHKWLPVLLSMPKMIKELQQTPDLGLMNHHQWLGRTTFMVQYWQSFEQLETYAKSKTGAHLPAWTEFNKKIGSNGDVGIWHETYLVKPGNFESIYNNMPLFGLAKATKFVPISTKLMRAKDRINTTNSTPSSNGLVDDSTTN
jgi:hypothetical protein